MVIKYGRYMVREFTSVNNIYWAKAKAYNSLINRIKHRKFMFDAI